MRTSVAIALLVASGCGGSLAELRKDNQRLAQDVSALRAELRAERRKATDLERQLVAARDPRADGATPGPVAVVPPPALPVEVLSPDAVPENGALVDDEDVTYVGDATAPPIEIDPDELRRGGDRPPPRDPGPRGPSLRDLPTSTALREPPRAPRAPAPTAAADDPALALYRQGQVALKAHDHAAAVAAFRALIARYPTHEYADNAQYWIGEAFYDQKDYPRAVSEFRATVAQYPLGNKVPDALLKVGLAYAALGDTAKARAALTQVMRQYPTSSSAAIASARLEQLP